MKAKIIKTEAEYTAALARVEALMDAKPGSQKEEELELWALLVERYEQGHFPIDLPDPVEAIKFRMEQEGLRQKDLEKFFSRQESGLGSPQSQAFAQHRHDPPPSPRARHPSRSAAPGTPGLMMQRHSGNPNPAMA